MNQVTRLRAIAALASAAFVSSCTDSGSRSPSAGEAAVGPIHVHAAAMPGGSGKSWSDALNDLHAALALAEWGDEIWVAAGTYTPAPPNGDRLVSFAMKSGVALYGGFAGHETQLGQRDVAQNETILSGDLNGDDGPEFENSGENSIHVVVAIGVDDRGVLDGFTIQCGRADGPGFGPTPDSQDQGAGINIYHGAPVIARCTIKRNWTINHGSVNDHGDASTFIENMWCANHSEDHGAGLYVHHHSMATVIDCTFLANDAVLYGGGTYCRSEHGALFVGCTWIGNRAFNGAGMFNAEMSAPRVENSEFIANEAVNGGGGMFCELSNTHVESCLFEGNSAGIDISAGGGGGGGSGGGGFWSTGGAPFVVSCTFRDNEASFGGGVYHIEESAAVVLDCDIVDNRATEGGGLYTLSSPSQTIACRFLGNFAGGSSFSVGGGMSNYFSESVVLDCLFRGNSAELGGGGMYCEGAQPYFSGLRFEGNDAFGSLDGFGGGLLNGFFADPTIVNCTFSLNRARRGGGMHNMFGTAGEVVNCTFAGNIADQAGGLWIDGSSTTFYTNCIVWGSTPDDHVGPLGFAYGCTSNAAGAIGSIGIDPLLVRMPGLGADLAWGTDDDDFGDLHVAESSPCIDAGSNPAVPAGVKWDLEGAVRFHDEPLVPDTGLGSSPIVDMGAFERNAGQ